jgi:hypothetical protein
MIQPLPYARLAKLIVDARKEEDTGLLQDRFHANDAFVEFFCGECQREVEAEQ